ncbi:hypothetical protein PG990_008286 [Apiospora arundinis]|uniref:Adipose-regulatory protein-domain-containing protein n=1 Tax=Apiospora arundinis TaxID=335852 RepID=A0ABR2JM98_9PEZI
MSLVVNKAVELVKRPIRLATAPTAQRAYINTLLFISTSAALLCIAALAYPVFYYSYVPKKVVSLPIHLQYNAGVNPYGLTSLSHDLMLDTAYDVSVHLTLPRSPPNLGHGNFMVALVATRSVLDDPAQSWGPQAFATPVDPYADLLTAPPGHVVFSSRRPALLPYEDPFVSRASRALFLFWHILVGSATSSAGRITLDLPMGELVEFRDQLPLSLLLDVQAGQNLQVYAARVELVARLTGLRWLMYNHRLISFVVCTGLFWSAEMITMAAAWAILMFFFGGSAPGGGIVRNGPYGNGGGFGGKGNDSDSKGPPPSSSARDSVGSGAATSASGSRMPLALVNAQGPPSEDESGEIFNADGFVSDANLARARAEKRPVKVKKEEDDDIYDNDYRDRKIKDEDRYSNDRKIKKKESVERGLGAASTLGSPKQSKRHQRSGSGKALEAAADKKNGDDYEDEDEDYQDIGAGVGTGSSYDEGGADGSVRRRSSSSGKKNHQQRPS